MDCETRKRRLNEDKTRSHSFKMRSRYIPEEIVLDVLPRLPAKSRGRFRCVSKQWCRWISDIRRLKVLVRTEEEDHEGLGLGLGNIVSFFSIDQNMKFEDICRSGVFQESWYNPWRRTLEYHDIRGEISGSCNGMVLISEHSCTHDFTNGMVFSDEYNSTHSFIDLCLLNPSTRYCEGKLSHKLSHDDTTVVASGLCFDAYNDDYKALFALSYDKPSITMVSFKHEMWTHLDFPYQFRRNGPIPAGPVLNDHLHWLAYKEEDNSSQYQIVYFDPKTNMFVDVPTPDLNSNLEGYAGTRLCVFDGCLCIVRYIRGKSYEEISGNFEILVMKEYFVKESWSTLFKIELGGDECYIKLEPLIYTEDKEMVLMSVLAQCRSAISAFDRNGKFCFNVKVMDDCRILDMTTVYEETFVRPTWYDNLGERHRLGEDWKERQTMSYAEKTRRMLLEL